MGLLKGFKSLIGKAEKLKPEHSENAAKTNLGDSCKKLNNNYEPWSGNNSNSDFSNANFLNRYSISAIGKTNDDYPRYISYTFNIANPILKHREMIENGYLEKGKFPDALKKLKLPKLKAILTAHHLPTSGKKSDLVQRILTSDIDKSTIDIPPVYVLSDKGKEYIKKYDYYIEIVKYLGNGEVTLDEFDRIKAQQPHLSVRDIVWQIYNTHYIEHQTNGDYGLLRNLEMLRYELLETENQLTDAAYRLIAALYYELSGMSNGNYISNFEDVAIYPWACEALKKFKDYITDEMIDKCYSRLHVPFRYFDKSAFKNIVHDIIAVYENADEIDLNNYPHHSRP